MLKQTDVSFPDLSGIFQPKSVVVVGASERAGNLGGDTVFRLKKFGFPGPVWAINRSLEPVCGFDAYADFASLPETPELAVFCIPADGLYDSIKDAIARGVRAGVAYAGGLAEAGGDGVRKQEEITRLCRENGFMLCGPNCVGTINAAHPVTATFATALHELEVLRPGEVSIVSQSGGIGTTVLTEAEEAGFGLRHMISCGNEAVLTVADYLHAFAVDEGTKVIAAYLEGIRDPERFILALEEARRRDKPVVLIKAGTTATSARAAQAHTGAMVGEDRVFESILREFGVIRVYSVEELIDVALLLAGTPAARNIKGNGVGLVTFGGGNGVIGSDQCAQHGLVVPVISDEGMKQLQPLLVSVASAANPLDLTPSTAFRPEHLAKLPAALDIFAAEAEIDSVLFIAGSLASKAEEISKVFVDFSERSPKAAVMAWPAPPKSVPGKLAEKGIYTYFDTARAIRAISRIVAGRTITPRKAMPLGDLEGFGWGAFVPQGGSPVVTEDRCHAILGKAGISIATGRLATNAAEAAAIAAELGFPVVLKGISAKVTHRADAGLLAVGLDDAQSVAGAYERLDANARDAGIEVDGFYVQKMMGKSGELLVAAMRDPIFGVTITVGAGGGMTEILDDVVTARAPVDPETAASMIERLRIRAKMKQDGKPVYVAKAAEFVSRFSALASTAPWEKFVFEINPILVGNDYATAVDGLLIIEDL